MLIDPQSPQFRSIIPIAHHKTCSCNAKHINCLTAKEWFQYQMPVWSVQYESRDVSKQDHPAIFPIQLANRVIRTFSHAGELVVDPFCGSGTSLIAAQDCDRNCIGFELNAAYAQFAYERHFNNTNLINTLHASRQYIVHDDCRQAGHYIAPRTIRLVWTSPPYANLLDRKMTNKSRRIRKNQFYGKNLQYSRDPQDFGILSPDIYQTQLRDLMTRFLPLMRPDGDVVINIQDFWWENQRVSLYTAVVAALHDAGFELRNTLIWDKSAHSHKTSIFGYPSNFVATSNQFEFLIHFKIRATLPQKARIADLV